jgi:hypothetical protein
MGADVRLVTGPFDAAAEIDRFLPQTPMQAGSPRLSAR